MKVFMYYEDAEDESLHKTLKMTLPKSWKTGPTSRLLTQFVESYNLATLDASQLHLCLATTCEEDETKTTKEVLASDAIVQTAIPDRANLFVCHGPSMTEQELKKQQQGDQEISNEQQQQQNSNKTSLVVCTHFGCQQRFPKGGPYPPSCVYHKSPPVFHETAKFWSCCPNKKAYDWNDFEAIRGCQTGTCSEIPPETTVMGGVELRAAAGGGAPPPTLKSIDDFNKAHVAGSNAAPVLERLEQVMIDLGIEKELFQQVVDGIRKEATTNDMTDAQALEVVAAELGSKLKGAMKAIAVEQLRLK